MFDFVETQNSAVINLHTTFKNRLHNSYKTLHNSHIFRDKSSLMLLEFNIPTSRGGLSGVAQDQYPVSADVTLAIGM